MTQLSATPPRTKQKKEKKSNPRPGARGIFVDDHERHLFVIIEPRSFGDAEYWCVNLTLSNHAKLSGHCRQAIDEMQGRRPEICRRDPEQDDIEPYETTGVIVIQEPKVNSVLGLAYHRWTTTGIESEGTRIPSTLFGRVRRVVCEA